MLRNPDLYRQCLRDRRSFLCLVGVALTGLIPHATNAQSPEAAGSVEEVKGDAFAEARAGRRTLERASPVFVSDQVGTGPVSRLKLRLGRDTTLQLGENVRLSVDRHLRDAGGEFTLGAGAMLFDRPAGGRPEPVRIRSSYGLIAVRGTRFFAGPSNAVFGVFVENGSVTVSSGGQQVVLRAGEGTDIREPGVRPTPPRRWGEARIRAALTSVS